MRALKWMGLAALIGMVAVAVGVASMAQLRWRAALVISKAQGGYPEATWEEFLRMLAPGSGFWLEELPRLGSLYAVASNPHTAGHDLEAGEALYLERCASCHGADGTGGAGPPLAGRGSARTASDWAMYRTIQYGVPETAMLASDLDWLAAWRLTAFARSLVIRQTERAPSGAISRLEPVTFDRLVHADDNPQDWLTYAGSYTGGRYSPLDRITRDSVSSLVVKWIHQPRTNYQRIETTPLVADGVMYIAFPPADVAALDARTGRELWHHAGRLPSDLPTEGWKVNRGVALLDDMVFIATLDNRVKALDARTGALKWERVLAYHREGYSFTGAPLAVKDLVVIGSSGGDFPTRGFIVALDSKTGEERWRFRTIPNPGEPGSDTWAGDSWQQGGAAAWMTGSYDAVHNRIYWGIGNPAPDHNGSVRQGDNLYSNSLVALNADTGQLEWHFQFTPHDLHDWDSTQVPVIGETSIFFANRNAFFYRLERSSGRFLGATPFVRQTWAERIEADGRPVRFASAEPSVHGSVVYPSLEGATNWWPPAFDPLREVFFVPFLERGGVFYLGTVKDPEPGIGYMLGSSHGVLGEQFHTGIKALDSTDGTILWTHRNASRIERPETAGLLATAGGVVFGADTDSVFALDSDSGEKLWSFSAGSHIAAAPMTFLVEGEQYVVLPAGRALLAFGLPND